MKERTEQSKRFAGDRKGFVLPAIVFGLMLMSTMAVLVMMTAGDEQLSSRAMREAGAAFYAAEAGLQQTYSQWDTYQAKVDSLEPGDSLDLGWQDLAGGSRYRAVIMQWDNEGGAQTLYGITVRGRGPGQVTGHKRLSLTITVGDHGGVGRAGRRLQARRVLRGSGDGAWPRAAAGRYRTGWPRREPAGLG
jgi:Tfp pilus assembly protein PilX